MFICNHCPYVKAINHKLVRDARDLKALGVHSVAIMSNDTLSYPEDSFEQMRRVARQFAYPFPYLIDETQEVARAYGAVCTPDFFGYNADLELQYRGRLDESGRQPDSGDVRRELYLAMQQVAETGTGTERTGCRRSVARSSGAKPVHEGPVAGSRFRGNDDKLHPAER